jgi:hypothetical protein
VGEPRSCFKILGGGLFADTLIRDVGLCAAAAREVIVACCERGNKTPTASIDITGADTAENPMNLFGPSGVYYQ